MAIADLIDYLDNYEYSLNTTDINLIPSNTNSTGDTHYLTKLGKQYKNGEILLDNKEAKLFGLMFEGREDMLDSNICIGEVIEMIKSSKDIDMEIEFWEL